MPLDEAQPEKDSELALMFVPSVKSLACGEEGCGENEYEGKKYGEKIIRIFRNNAARHVYYKYRRLMTCEKCDMNGD